VTAEFRLLGEIEVRVAGRLVDIGHVRQRCVLTVLLIEANRSVSVDQLVDRVWGARRQPDRPANALQTYVSLLRRALSPVENIAITRQPAGYKLTVDDHLVDMHLFRRLMLRAQASDNGGRAALLEQALHLWRADALANLDTPWINAVRDTLNNERRAAQLDLTDIELARGHHATLLATLSDQTGANPLDERLAGQFMLALYRSGRQADALAHFRRLQRRLAEELGSDPSPPMRELHQRILTADATLADTPAGRQATTSPVPRQVPAAPRLFTGRARELSALTGAQADAASTVVISAIGGSGGIGKTWLALHWAHRNLDRFPDGQLYVNLRGFDPTDEPMPVDTAVRGFLVALGVDQAAVPAGLDAQVGLYRSLLADRRMLVVLDNAADAGQVAPLLPGSAGCTVLVTSRRRLTSLVTAHGAQSVDLDVLTEAESRELLARHLGADRLAADEQDVADLLAYCAGLPLAINIVAARANAHPDFPLSVVVDELRDHTGRLAGLDTGDTNTSLRAIVSWSHHAVSAPSAAMFELLGLAPGPDIGVPAVASLTALPSAVARTLLRELEDSYLVGQHEPGRYRIHDLVGLYAAEQAQRRPPEYRATALRRLVEFYVHTAVAAERLLDPHQPPIDVADPAPGHQPEVLADEAAALTWFTTEHQQLLAAQHLAQLRGWPDAVWRLAWTLDAYHWRRGHLHEDLTAWRAGLAAAEQLADQAVQARAHRRIAHAYVRLGRHDEAQSHGERALVLAENIGDLPCQAHTRGLLAWVSQEQGDDRRALGHATKAMRLFEAIDNPVWLARIRNDVGQHEARLGNYSVARKHSEAALEVARAHQDRAGQANMLDVLGYVARQTGEHAQARDYYEEALAVYRDLGHTYEEATTLVNLGDTYGDLGRQDEATIARHQALALYRDQHRTVEADRIRRQLDAG
jgi:DNA-binding SARP family transcriptional activator/tetratricopeptide (TPR) repeat protein